MTHQTFNGLSHFFAEAHLSPEELRRYRIDSDNGRRALRRWKFKRLNYHHVRNTVSQFTTALAIGLPVLAHVYA